MRIAFRYLYPVLLFLICIPANHGFARENQSTKVLCKRLFSSELRTSSSRQQKRETIIHELARRDHIISARCLLKAFADPYTHIQEETIDWIARKNTEKKTLRWLIEKGIHYNNRAIQKNIARLVRRKGTSFAVEEFVDEVRRQMPDSPSVRRHVARALSRGDIDGIDEVLQRLISDEDARVAAEAVRTLKRMSSSSDIRSRLEELFHQRAGEVRSEALLGMNFLPPSELRPEVASAIEDRDWKVRLAGYRLLKQFQQEHPAFVLEMVKQLRHDERWEVRREAIRALSSLNSRGAGSFLIRRFDTGEGRMVRDMTEALQDITGQQMGNRPEKWVDWWKQLSNEEKERRLSRHRDEQPQNHAREVESAYKTQSSFFRIPIISRRVGFVLDFSGGMQDEVEAKRSGNKRSKIAIVKEEMNKTIDQMSSAQKFNIIIPRYYSKYPPETELQHPFGALRPAGPRAKRAVKKWLRQQEPEGWGAFYQAFEYAVRSQKADTVVFLSDGRPTRGRYREKKQFLEALKRLRRYHPVRVHCVLIGDKGIDRKFMKSIAERTGGIFVKR